MTMVQFLGTTIGLIVRGKHGDGHHPWDVATHADCVLSNGECIGFFGQQEPDKPYFGWGWVSESLNQIDQRHKSGYGGHNMNGVVYDMPLLHANRPQYVDFATAKMQNTVSTLLVLHVGVEKAKKFDASWAQRKKNPPSFWATEFNCASRAGDSFVDAGILTNSMAWEWDSPDNLFHRLKEALPHHHEVITGIMGFVPQGAGYRIEVEDLV